MTPQPEQSHLHAQVTFGENGGRAELGHRDAFEETSLQFETVSDVIWAWRAWDDFIFGRVE